MKGVYWLASYPKSGNTWVRAFLASYLFRMGQGVDINALPFGPLISQREFIDDWLGMESADMPDEEVDRYRPEIHSRLVESDLEYPIYKTHERYRLTCDGRAIFPKEGTRGVVLVVRDPRDIAHSLANHLQTSIEGAIEVMNTSSFVLDGRSDSVFGKFPEETGSWTEHANSWLSAPLRRHIIRYEDMILDPIEAFSSLLDFLECPLQPSVLKGAIENTQFEMLKRQEASKGFNGKNPNVRNFFKSGEAGVWNTQLTPSQVARLVLKNRKNLSHFGYCF
ncbi:sulfotransferase domain-containing protein [Puniceicoccaceae bacterium K14]|nr:sulfotransferase domain-containing protein [Puniceicoccaceae bacterium K14]